MKKVRGSVFETNSSSVNTLVISDSDKYTIPKKLTALNLWDGRSFYYDHPDEKFTVILSYCSTSDEIYNLCWKLYSWGVEEIVLPNPNTYKDYEWSNYIHVGETDDSDSEFEELLDGKHDEELKRFLFSDDSYIEGQDDNYIY